MSRVRTEQQKANEALYHRTHFKSQRRHYKLVADLSPAELRRLDNALRAHIPLSTLANRFDMEQVQLRARRRELLGPDTIT